MAEEKKEKNYTVEGDTVYADIAKLTDDEVKEVKRFQDFGFKLEYTVHHKHEAKKNKPEKSEKKKLKQEYILEYLEMNDVAGVKEYEEKRDEIAVDKEGKEKTTSTGKPRKKGFNAGKYWFTRKYPVDVAVAKNEIESAGLTKELNEDYKKYKESKSEEKEEKDVLNQEEYTRTFYWNKGLFPDKPTKQ